MFWITLQHFLKVRDGGIFVLRVLLESLAKAKVSVDRLAVDFDSVNEVLCGTLTFTKISQ